MEILTFSACFVNVNNLEIIKIIHLLF
jgi:hypothetical protein